MHNVKVLKSSTAGDPISNTMDQLKRLRHKNFNHALWPFSCLLFFALAFVFLGGFYPIVRFVEEQIDIYVYPEHIRVEGTYVYKNPLPFPVIQGFSIPLPVDQRHPPPVLVAAKRLAPRKVPIKLLYLFGKHHFEVAFKAGEEVRVEVQYRQHAPEKNARYILTTSKPWRHPLGQGIYRLIPEDVKIMSSNYPLQSNGAGPLFFQEKGFMPQEDWHFEWEVTQS